MVTSARARVAHAAVALALAGPTVLLGGVAWADAPTPAPANATDPAATDATGATAPEPQPTIGSWIVGGTLLEGKAAAKPVAKPAAKPVAKPAAQPVAATQTGTRPATRAYVSTATASSRSTAAAATAPDGATALPFTGGHVDALLPAGMVLVIGGLVLTVASRPRRVLA